MSDRFQLLWFGVLVAVGGLAGAVSATMVGGVGRMWPGLVAGLVVGALGIAAMWVPVARRTERMAGLERVSAALAEGELDPGAMDLGVPDDITAVARNLLRLMGRLQGLRQQLDHAATGDLSRSTIAEGALARALTTMLMEQRSMVERIARSSSAVDRASTRLRSTAQEQEANATQQAAVVEQILRSMQTVSANASSVAQRAESVLSLAERTDGNNREIKERIDELASHAARIGEVLEVIHEIAHKSEILALNAALEGTRAGEAGRGFSLVASQMGQLSESVLAAVEDIKQLTRDIGDATEATVSAAAEAASGSAQTARAAREIRTSVRQQTVGTQQVGRGLEEISAALNQASTAARSSADEAEELAAQSQRLQELLGRFTLR